VKSSHPFEVIQADGQRVSVSRDNYWRLVVEPGMRAVYADPGSLYPRVLAALADGFAREALPFAEQLFRLAQGMEIGALVLAETQRKAGLSAESEETLRRQLAQTGESALLLLNLAKAEEEQGRNAEALAHLRASLKLDPNSENAVAWWRALHLERQGLEAAVQALEQLAQTPGAWRPQMWLGRMAQERGQSVRAVQYFRYAVTSANFERSCVLMAVGSLSRADSIAVLSSFDAMRHPADAGFLLVECLAEEQRRAEAEAVLRALEVRPDRAIAAHAQSLRKRLGLG
jgi:tetratricopeptide (TPR) repeat protein